LAFQFVELYVFCKLLLQYELAFAVSF